MPIIETVVIRRRIPVDPAEPVVPYPYRAWENARRLGPPQPLPPVQQAPIPLPIPSGGGNGTIPTNIPGAVNRLAGPYALPVSEIAVGAFFAVYQIQHVFERVVPGAAQLWRAGGSGPGWNILAALVGLGAAIHGIYGVFKVREKKKKLGLA